MHCPSCGQKQIAEETKFCSRCGFSLALVSEILANGGVLPQLIRSKKDKKKRLTRRNGLIFSLFWFMFFGLLLAAIFAIAGVEELAAISGAIGTMGGLIFLIASFVLLKPAPENQNSALSNLSEADIQNLSGTNQTALPAQQSTPVSAYAPPAGNWRDTNDLAQPSSVTEQTTKLLERD